MRRIILAILALFFAQPAVAAVELAAPEALAQAQAGKIVILDVRTPGEWRQTGIAPGAKTADFLNSGGADAFVAQVLKAAGGNKAAPLAVVCRSGNRSAKAVALLESRGFTNLRHMGEGMNGWVGRGLPVTQWAP
ncbi:MAG: rhodanese-like domain-containing protein [Rhodospirillaceae bacterium]|nr:rhodanese-like domain-containing protein [Rhodospirillales bacterium]